jgi:NarL family two-component system response regulator LiaR
MAHRAPPATGGDPKNVVNPPCRVLLADNHTLFRQALRSLLNALPDLTVVGEAADETEAGERARLLRPDVVLLAAWLPDRGALEALSGMKQRFGDARVIVLGAEPADPRAMYDAIRGGAMGYLPRTSGVDDLVTAIRQVALGQAALPAAALTGLVDFITSRPPEPVRAGPDKLSEREQEVLDLVAEGKSNREIADSLYISESTVRTHVHNILSKLSLANRVQAAAFALGVRVPGRAATAA